MTTPTVAAAADRRAAIKFIICVGLVSLFADMTYEGAHSVIGPYMKDLGAGAAMVGFVAGFGEMIAAGARYFSGKLADKTRAYWTIVIASYSINIIVIPAVAFVSTWQAVALLIIAERTGKAMRGPARDLLLSEATSVVGHGFGFGLHAAMDQTGAVVGPLLVSAVIAQKHQVGPAFLVLGIPAVLAVVSILLAYSARNVAPTPPTVKQQDLPKVFTTYVAASGLLACGFLDFPLLSYHFEQASLFKPETIPFLYACAMGMVGLAALVFGRLYDRFGIRVLTAGILVSMLMLPLGFLFGRAGAIASVLCWGLGLGVQDATLRGGIAEVVSMNKRGTAFGIFNGVYGVMWFAGSALMGLMYDYSFTALVAFGLISQIIAAVMFFRLSNSLRAARVQH